jgi:DNA (cytosine-5)-methyltransferase 1
MSEWDDMPGWMKTFIMKNNELWQKNKEFIDKWMVKAKKNPLFFGAKAKFEWQAGETKHPNVWDHIMQIRPSGLRVKPGTYFPALVAITQTSIVGKRKRFLTPRECARLQSFPDTFKYDVKNAQAYKQFGNSINVALVKLFAQYMFGDKEVQHKYSYEVQFGKEEKEPTLFSGMFDDE